MHNKTLITLILVCNSHMVFSQCTEFIVYRTKGDVTILPGFVRGIALKNTRLNQQSVLNVAPEGSVILLSGNDKALRIALPGNYSYTEIVNTCRKTQTSLTREYIKYVAQAITEKDEPLTAMIIKGAVYRTRKVYEKTDMIQPADSSVISADIVRFAWHATPGIALKYLKIYENGVKEVYSKSFSDTTTIIGSELFTPQNFYFWLVTVNQKPTDNELRFNFVFGDKDWKTEFLDNEDQWMKELETEINATEKKLKK
jgi:hypothetical protein